MSLADFEQRLLLAPFDAELRLDYAQALLAAGRAEAAAAQARLLLQQSPADVRARELLAAALATEPAQAAAPAAVPQAVAAGPGHLQLVTPAVAPSVHALAAAPADKVRFSSIVGMEALKKTLRIKIIEPYLKPGLFDRFRMNGGGGLLLYGPPGCGKTLLARALANECKAGFISVGVSDVLSMWQGESERNLAALFARARSEQPCVLFFDELDALAYARSKAGAASARTVVNEFLAQLDGFGRENKGVLMLAATNMPWDVDDAMKRPGRFSRQIFVPPPDAEARRAMFELKLLGVPASGLDLAALAARSQHCSGADIDGLIELAKESALVDALDGDGERGLTMADFDAAFAQLQPSTLEWLRTVRNVVKYAGDDGSFKEVAAYLKQSQLL